MGDDQYYTSDAKLGGETDGLGQLGKLQVQICQRPLQDFAVAGVLGNFELLQYMLAAQP
jgi:hypothetical protein